MFTLSGRFLEDGENLFQDFWSPFSISFLCFSARNYLKNKKVTDLTGPCPTWTLARPALISRGGPSRSHPAHKPQPPPEPRRAAAAPPAPDLAGGSRRRPRSSFFFETLDPVFLDRFFSVYLFSEPPFVRFNKRFSPFSRRQRTFVRYPVRQIFFFSDFPRLFSIVISDPILVLV